MIVDPLNSTQTTTLANLNTLGSLITAFATVANDAWRARFLKAATPPSGATPKNTLEAMAGIARAPWAEPKELFALFDEAYPQPKDGCTAQGTLRAVSRLTPRTTSPLALFRGRRKLCRMAGSCSMRRATSGAARTGCPARSPASSQHRRRHDQVRPNGTALSPAITGFTGMGVDGVGWGTGVSLDKVWVSGFNGKIGVMDFNGKPVGKESDFPMAGKTRRTAWASASPRTAMSGSPMATKNHLLYFPGGRVKDGRIVKVTGLKSPFGVAIDAQNRVWVSNSQSDTVVRFPADDPSKAESFRAGISVRGIALDSKGNLWAASNMSSGLPAAGHSRRRIDHGAVQDRRSHIFGVTNNPTKTTGVVNMIRPDGTQPAPTGFTGDNAINVPWGLSIDGNDDVWVGNFWGRGVVLMAGDDTKGHPAGTKTGDVIHQFQSGSIQMITDVAIDPAGNVWAANNWKASKRSSPTTRSVAPRPGAGLGHHHHLRRRRTSEDPAHGSGAPAMSQFQLSQ